MSTTPPSIRFSPEADADLAVTEGTIVVFVDGEGALAPGAVRLDKAMGGALTRSAGDEDFKAKAGAIVKFAFPSGTAARAVIMASLGSEPGAVAARKTGGAIAKALGKGAVTIATGGIADDAVVADLVLAVALRLYDFREYKSASDDEKPADASREITVLADRPETLARLSAPHAALAEGIFFTRDLVNEPANRLTTDEFAARLAAMQELGLEVEILGEEELEKIGARALLAVGQGSASESKLVVMRWQGGKADEPPLALVGKGVVFDTGGISLKPAAGMEDMTMDMGGAGVVAGVMRTLALRKAKANVIGVVGLVENMPDGLAQRPGDIVKSMKGDTIEVINTDAEGRLVLADALWYTQETYQPRGVIDLATLTGAIIIALGHHRAGWYANDDEFAAAFAAACEASGDDAWRMPLGKPYAEQIKSRKADVKNTGGRQAGSITAAEFLARFIKDGMPWIHIDIAGVAETSSGTDLAPKGATGWGVAALDTLIREEYEG
ncbi:leucyl aminopeptidase [Limibaculum sp. M0105]|uniref:Probable cytosol aminopeptidase n=1 Tax=Thermohalobaculum xanthum TaxID=2753746 RepID=A0A8J7SEA2_9RHOB|nr:leucyl aminopeptidase [Thermohalobaculum xanthum]MBK0398847.1 leucyl aminopeptidase [Thermohalobaculum xanthum]